MQKNERKMNPNKFKIIACLILFVVVLINLGQVNGKCTECLNGGICSNLTCMCAEGFPGVRPESCHQTIENDKLLKCSSKVRLTEPQGYIHDGLGNYSIGVKCSWLIDARDHSPLSAYGANHSAFTSEVDSNNVRSLPKIKKTSVIRLHLEEFATECGWDHLYVYDGDSVKSPLLAVFSGLMYKNNFSIRRIPEVVAHSGSALLHFFSDDAYNMSGFNISYRIDACPTTNSALNCSGHGVCIDGICSCESDFTGPGCNIEKCPNGCTSHLHQGHCNKNHCKCKDDFAGSDCSLLSSAGVWDTINTDVEFPPGSASHIAAVWRDTLHIIGGESYGRSKPLGYTYDFNGKVWETLHMDGNFPKSRYGASSVMYGDKIFMYGGVVQDSGICGELWAFDVSAKNWENITVKTEPCNSTFAMCPPLESVGHSATLIPGYNGAKTQLMIVIFGHSPIFGFLNTVQEYNFGTREWRVVTTRGYPVKGGYGHSASYDPLTELIYVYGGIISESESAQLLSNKLYSYEPRTSTWTMLVPAATARYLHTANFISPGLMLVFGGNTHNDTSHSFGAKCYSNDLLLYDVLCDSWHIQTMPQDLRADLARFGHSAVMFEKKLYIYGGFDGQMLSDMIKYTPGNCSVLLKAETCLSTRPGLKCIWDIQRSKCIAVSEAQKSLVFARDQDTYTTCKKEGRQELTQLELLNYERCNEQISCQGCVSSSFNCIYCGNANRRGVCTLEKCPDPSYKPRPVNVFINQLEKCPKEPEPVCAQLHVCQACMSHSICHWNYELSKCMYFGNRSSDLETIPCPPACSSLTTCSNCTQEDCIWCQNEERCVDKNAYTASFPYGQCREWTTYSTKCRAPTAGTSQCSFYKTCSQCRDDPACGWCDDGSMTGLGKCLTGGDSGPQDKAECSANHWHFTHCPTCQCNGHSTCPDRSNCQQPCENLTYGPNCDKCKPGYWGNPVNGGSCQKCECNAQASFCNSETGKCFCSTKGLAGDHCEKCDATNHYHGDPSKGSCYYDLTIDYQFTFNLSKKEDRHYTQINFRNSPIKADIDADFTITCSVPAKMNITIRTDGQIEKPLFSNINCSTFRHRFSKAEHNFGIENNVTITTFYVYVYDFNPPLWIQIAFSQYPKLNLQQFFITFSTCFLLLLLMAAILWKIKQKYDMFRRRQRLFVEMEQMAQRPFSQVLVEVENKEYNEISPVIESAAMAKKRNKKDAPSPIALEPCDGNKAAVLSLLVRLPTGDLHYSPPGQSAGLAVASALVTLGNPRRASIDNITTKETAGKSSKQRKQSPHPHDNL